MNCQICGEKEATVHLTQMLNNEVRKLHLCEGCARENGLDLDGAGSMTDFLLGLGAAGMNKAELSGPKQGAVSSGRELVCPRCGMKLSDFKKISRLGCQDCYVTFSGELEPLLQGMQKGLRHVGKKPTAHAANVQMPPSVLSLKKELEEAVAAENYEEAALLRDRIKNENG